MNIQHLLLGFLMMIGVTIALSNSPLFPDNIPQTGMPTDSVDTYNTQFDSVMDLLNDFDLTTGIIAGIIFTFMIITKTPILAIYGLFLSAGNIYIKATLTDIGIDSYFINVIKLMFTAVIILSIIAYFNGRRMEQS